MLSDQLTFKDGSTGRRQVSPTVVSMFSMWRCSARISSAQLCSCGTMTEAEHHSQDIFTVHHDCLYTLVKTSRLQTVEECRLSCILEDMDSWWTLDTL